MKNLVYWKLSGFCFMFFFSWLVFFAFLPIWFGQKLELSGIQIGTIYACNAIFTMLFQPCYGYISDKIGMKKYLLYFITLLVAFTGPFFVFIYGPFLQNIFFAGVILSLIHI